jgi:phage shock protein A
MKNEPATKNDVIGIKNDILELKQGLESTIKGLDSKAGGLDSKIEKLDSKVQSLEVKIDATEWRTIQLEDRVSNFQEETRQNFNKVISAMDGLASRFTDANIEKASFNSALYRHEDKLDNHEARISALENGETSFQPIKS